MLARDNKWFERKLFFSSTKASMIEYVLFFLILFKFFCVFFYFLHDSREHFINMYTYKDVWLFVSIFYVNGFFFSFYIALSTYSLNYLLTYLLFRYIDFSLRDALFIVKIYSIIKTVEGWSMIISLFNESIIHFFLWFFFIIALRGNFLTKI